jgi:hypothetical protein
MTFTECSPIIGGPGREPRDVPEYLHGCLHALNFGKTKADEATVSHIPSAVCRALASARETFGALAAEAARAVLCTGGA